jgi:hypothetical protein
MLAIVFIWCYLNYIFHNVRYTNHIVGYAIWGKTNCNRRRHSQHSQPHINAAKTTVNITKTSIVGYVGYLFLIANITICLKNKQKHIKSSYLIANGSQHCQHAARHHVTTNASHATVLALPTLPTLAGNTLAILLTICLPFWLSLPLSFCLGIACHFA